MSGWVAESLGEGKQLCVFGVEGKKKKHDFTRVDFHGEERRVLGKRQGTYPPGSDMRLEWGRGLTPVPPSSL